MKMRQHKKLVILKMMWGGIGWGLPAVARSFAAPDWVGHTDPALHALADNLGVHPMVTDFLGGPSVHSTLAVEQAKIEYVCERVKDGVVVDSFDTREDALGLLNKHFKQKKAKLQIRNSATGELEPFTTDEMFA